MKGFLTKASKIILRHPFLYLMRYILLSKNNQGESVDAVGCFNDVNTVLEIPKVYFDINQQINLHQETDELEKAIEIGRFLRKNISGGAGLGLSSEQTLQKMLDGKGGVCSDFSQIFNIFCLINQIKVKEWGCIDRFYNTRFGHSFNEIYSTAKKKWIAIDIHKSVIFAGPDNVNPLSALELFTSLRNGNQLNFILFSAYIPIKLERIYSVYSKTTIPFVISNYKNKVYDYFLNKFKKYPPFMINGLMILLGKNHDFVFMLDNYKVKLLPKSLRNLNLISFFSFIF